MKTALETIQQDHRIAVDGLFEESGDALAKLVEVCVAALKNNKKLLFCGNGGSACDAMHIAGEFVGRYMMERPSLPAIALTADSGVLTAIANDYAYEDIFARQIEGLGVAGDVLIALSTSGKSPNVLKVLATAKTKGIATVLFTGEKGRGNAKMADITIISPSLITAHVQEAHMVALHAMASLVEAQIFAK